MNKEQQELLNEVYRHYLMEDAKILPNMSKEKMTELGYGLTQEEFINKCKTDPEFSERWGLKIEERELSLEEKTDWLNKNYPLYGLGEWAVDKLSDKGYLKEVEVEYNIPTKLITITYNDKTIENYE